MPSLTRRRVFNLLVQLLLGLARAVILGSMSRRTHDHILLSHTRLPQPGGPGSRIYIPPGTGWLSYTRTGFPFRRLLRLVRLTWKYFKPPPHRLTRLVLHITARHGPHRKRISQQFFYCFKRDCCGYYLATAVVLLFVSRLLPSNECTCHNNTYYPYIYRLIAAEYYEYYTIILLEKMTVVQLYYFSFTPTTPYYYYYYHCYYYHYYYCSLPPISSLSLSSFAPNLPNIRILSITRLRKLYISLTSSKHSACSSHSSHS
jgi:hypothetical protein